MNIAYIHNVAKIGGAERVTLDIIAGVQPEHCAFLAAPEDGPLLEAARKAGANAQVVSVSQPERKRPIKTWISHQQWKRYFTENRIDIIHTGDLFITRSLIHTANALGIPLVCHIHFPIDEAALAWIFKTPPKRACFVYCSQELHDHTAQKIQSYVPAAQHLVIHNGVDTELYQRYLPKKGLLPAEKTNVGIVANLQERKGHLEFITAASRVAEQCPDVQFHIIGGDLFGESREAMLKQKAKDLNLAAKMTFHGQVPNVKDYLNELDVFVCASYEEAFPISILEAMAFGLCIVSTDVNGIPEALEDRENALLIPPSNSVALGKATSQAARSQKLRARLGQKAKQTVSTKFNLNNINMKIKAIYQKLHNNGPLR
ncbi:MAG: glycosyltransferase [Saccharospirillum sp.]